MANRGVRAWVRGIHPGVGVATVAVGAFILFLGISAALAPPIEATTPAGNGSVGDRLMNDSASSRAMLVGLQGPFEGKKGHAAVVNGEGDVVWKSPETWAHFDVSPLPDGRILSAFLRRQAIDCGSYVPTCARTGFRVFDTNATRPIVREWTYPVRSHLNSEVHDVEALPNGHVLVAGMDRERVFIVDENGDIVWEWLASSHYDAPSDPTTEDWLHINDVDRIGEDRYLVSVRNANQLVILERGAGVVDVINEDRDPGVIREQHNPQWLGNGSVLVADSGNDRVVKLTERNGTWELTWEITSVGGIGLHWPRDVDLLENGNFLITDTFNYRIVEVNRSGAVAWSVHFPDTIPYEADRLPHGEYPPGVLSGGISGNLSDVAIDGSPDFTVPGFTLLYSGISAFVTLPYWINQWHFVALVLTLFAVAGGLVWARWGIPVPFRRN